MQLGDNLCQHLKHSRKRRSCVGELARHHVDQRPQPWVITGKIRQGLLLVLAFGFNCEWGMACKEAETDAR
jgi:hypothetical protein